MERLMM